MIYRYPQAPLWRRGATIAMVVALHAVLLWALVSGLAYRVLPAARTEIVARIVDATPSFTPPGVAPAARVQPPRRPATSPAKPEPIQPIPRPRPTMAPAMAPMPLTAPVTAPKSPAPELTEPMASAQPSTDPAATRQADLPPVTPTQAAGPQGQPHTAAGHAPVPGVAVLCPGYVDAIQASGYPPQALEAGLGTGEVRLELSLDPEGRVQAVRVLQASDRVFARAAVDAAKRLQCKGTGMAQHVSLPITYRPPQGP